MQTEKISPSSPLNTDQMAIIIHYRKDTDDREFNLETILKFLNKNFTSEVIVVFDDAEYIHPNFPIEKYAKVLFMENKELFKKSSALNMGARQTNSDVLCFWDTDIILDPVLIEKSLTLLGKGEADHVYPFYGIFVDIKKGLFSEFLDGYNFEVALQELEKKSDLIEIISEESPGGCNIISRKAFERIQGYDEAFVGWGFEDTDFLRRSSVVNQVARITGKIAVCWHLHHDNAVRDDSPNFRANLLRYNHNRLAECIAR